ncbi:MAG TPA: hypothetical protein HA222_03670 [Candidatus Diapherotrites archaeon]|uniref:Uncharacterized protein n=1 Tax=Candidatus Iainarchaeum sp. TaxID=3101447 RepID=A0A7J4K0N8_9ARCH|nr:hypothetical protein [Candidatus Diapherotrites archaeon]
MGLLAFEKLAEQGFGRKELGTTFAVSPASNDYALLSKHASHLLREFKKP